MRPTSDPLPEGLLTGLAPVVSPPLGLDTTAASLTAAASPDGAAAGSSTAEGGEKKKEAFDPKRKSRVWHSRMLLRWLLLVRSAWR